MNRGRVCQPCDMGHHGHCRTAACACCGDYSPPESPVMNVGAPSGESPTRGGRDGTEHESVPSQAPDCETCGDYGLVEVPAGDVLVDIPCPGCAASDNWMTDVRRGK